MTPIASPAPGSAAPGSVASGPHTSLVRSVESAMELIRSGETIATSGFVGCGTPDALLDGLARRFRESGDPAGLTLLFAAGQGDGGEQGLNRLAEPGLLRRVVGGHWGLIPRVAALAVSGQIEGWNLPQGVISRLYRDMAAGLPGTVSRIGLHTFVDPRSQGGRVNERTTDDLVEVVHLGGEELLFYRATPIDVALLRGTSADEHGNITMEREALTLDNLAMACAARNNGGKVIVQVERIVSAGTLDPRLVKIPHILVDAVVVAPPELHRQTYATAFNPGYAHEVRIPLDLIPPMPMNERKIAARRAAMELPDGGVVNLGIGMPDGVSTVAAEEHVIDRITLTTEPGIVGGMPASGGDFGAALNPDALIDQNQQFDFYQGGGLDLTVLGMAELDADGNVNVSRFGPRLTGAGGFIDISQSARTVVFVGTFTAGGMQVGISDGRLTILSEGRSRKLVRHVEQVTFNGRYAASLGQRVLYVTERAVFAATPDGLRLIEVAPGIDVERDVLGQMDFAPIVQDVALMDSRIFLPQPMGLAALLRPRTTSTPTLEGVSA
ncbi:MAG TPA: CoA-transferase [Dermatophilaceae bacterium]|jgi:propionate CoA-transferase|uniref:Acyl CoA:acetate/3-ketoacid CoA transferase n=1 Tax=Candidatus Phosphoribacter hodrii TaxID=2953743 RepID=A0A935CEN9_9MICO|nr:acyl CoA:acetate/3-ketoacid CoA transferase [Candidatus Phosphoribacter hodrii]MBK6442895.1 acyl CoA:acetate/3-ketoacid CoA transferase [Candidatus Phosphoribacter baldrii]HNV15043.1 CoA-transferase [Dermatophilaceae bacterium]MBL0004667.1 acyl CoA:acetate/3-ketoacid CoA transferase [Candidatus Phosphoribacter hodrii]HOA03479.1 CoA-transferase [Dermatophilaceae bacterium]